MHTYIPAKIHTQVYTYFYEKTMEKTLKPEGQNRWKTMTLLTP